MPRATSDTTLFLSRAEEDAFVREQLAAFATFARPLTDEVGWIALKLGCTPTQAQQKIARARTAQGCMDQGRSWPTRRLSGDWGTREKGTSMATFFDDLRTTLMIAVTGTVDDPALTQRHADARAALAELDAYEASTVADMLHTWETHANPVLRELAADARTDSARVV
jgi:hypothetical protein